MPPSYPPRGSLASCGRQHACRAAPSRIPHPALPTPTPRSCRVTPGWCTASRRVPAWPSALLIGAEAAGADAPEGGRPVWARAWLQRPARARQASAARARLHGRGRTCAAAGREHPGNPGAAAPRTAPDERTRARTWRPSWRRCRGARGGRGRADDVVGARLDQAAP
eukprot:364747-Chlamydomonas_euryale.AAC.16